MSDVVAQPLAPLSYPAISRAPFRTWCCLGKQREAVPFWKSLPMSYVTYSSTEAKQAKIHTLRYHIQHIQLLGGCLLVTDIGYPRACLDRSPGMTDSASNSSCSSTVKASESQALCNRHKRMFTILAVAQSVIAIATGLVFVTLTRKRGMDWPLYLTSSIILSSMIRECLWSSGSWSADQRHFIPWPFISITAVTGILFILGGWLETRYTLFKHISAASAVAFRLWMVLEWVIVISGSSTSLTLLKMRLMLGVLAWMVTTTALAMESQLERDLANISGARKYLCNLRLPGPCNVTD
ncbi:hypothetical protein AUP68_02531 [Ilyonectria robusta]